jgi:IS5 family transposase
MPRGEQAETRRSRDGTWAKKGSKSHFGYKLHILMDRDYQLIRRFETTTASLHDSGIDLSRKGGTIYRDKGYFGVLQLSQHRHSIIRWMERKNVSY